MDQQSWLLYGATGYTGRLILEEALRRGHRPILGGRSAERLAQLAHRCGLDFRIAEARDREALDVACSGMRAVINAAGPVASAARDLLDAAIASHASFLDISGDVAWFENIFARDPELRSAGIAAIPGVGFDVVPTDCLSRRVVERLPGATQLEIAVGTGGGATKGTLRSMIGILAGGGKSRCEGVIVSEPMAARRSIIETPIGMRGIMSVPLADLSTAWHGTQVPTVTTAMMFKPWELKLMAPTARLASAMVRFALTRAILRAFVEVLPEGPSESARAHSKAYAWARATDTHGHTCEAWLSAPNAYSFTASAAIACVESTLRENPVGALGPAEAFGSSFVETLGGVDVVDYSM